MEETGTMMLQDIWPHRLRNQFTDKTDPTPDSPVFCFRKADLLTASSRDDAMEEEIDQSGEHGKRIYLPFFDGRRSLFPAERGYCG